MWNVLPAPVRLVAIGVMAGIKLADEVFKD